MCGIVGVYKNSGGIDRSLIETMRDTLSHRGPDDAGLWLREDGRLALAHRRLSIIDLSPAGHQPMSDDTGKYAIVFNGEIYNYVELRDQLYSSGHTFRTQTDTEVIIESYKEWGESCVNHLNGMFAFCIYDSEKNILFLARDRAGEKPLFYNLNENGFVFASELKALMADPDYSRVVDYNALSHYLAYGYVPGEMCMIANTNKLQQGHYLVCELESGRVRKECYWRLPDDDFGSNEPDLPALEEELEELLLDSVKRQLVADVPVGIMLSGGLDSSLVTACAARVASGNIKTFNVSFAGHKVYDEADYARQIASYFGTDHTELVAEPTSIDVLPSLVRQYDEPIADHSMIPTYMVSKEIRKYCTVALGGDGGDELFAGYKHYNRVQSLDKYRKFMPPGIRSKVLMPALQRLPYGIKGRNYLLGLCDSSDSSISRINLIFDKSGRDMLMTNDKPAGELPEDVKKGLAADAGSLLRGATTSDFRSYLVDDILVKVDRASMLTSLEVRAPFLDYRIIEFAFSRLPDELRANTSDRKIMLRRLARRMLPKDYDANRKQGFSIPFNEWLKGDWGDYISDVLHGMDERVFDKDFVQGLIDGQKKGRSNSARLFTLAFFELWRREYNIGMSG